MATTAYSAPAPIEHPALSRLRLRVKLERAIDRLMLALDDLDGDPDLEPSLGWNEVAANASQAVRARAQPLGGPEWTDLEDACEDEGMIDEDAEHDGREPDEGW